MNTLSNPPALFRFEGLSLVRVTGEDAVEFLHGQFSQKIRGLAGRVRTAGYCSPKGRLLAVFRAFSLEEGTVHLLMPTATAATFLKRIRMYVLRAKVKFELLEPAPAMLLAAGEAGLSALEAAGLPRPERGECLRSDGAALLGLEPAAGIEGFTRSGPRTLLIAEKLPEALASAAAAEADGMGDLCWRASEMAAGMPVILPETLDRFVPQAVNLELAGGVVFDKGCYPGQEVVSRVQHLGETKRRSALEIFSGEAPLPGSPVYAESSSGAEEAGAVVDAVAIAGRSLVFACASLSAVEAGFSLSPDGPAGEKAPLPYAYRNVLED